MDERQPNSIAQDQPDNPDTMSVAEAALALSVSRSTVYRMNRQNGPFKILKQGGRVLIDRDGFNRFVSGKAPASDPVNHQLAIATSSPSPPNARSSRKSGQRELVIPNRRPVVIFYMY